MTTPMISEQFARAILPILRKEWDQARNAVISPAAQLYGIESSRSSVEYSQGYGEFGIVPEYNSPDAEAEPASIAYDSFSPLFEKTFTHKEYAMGVAVERKLLDDNQTGQIVRKVRGLGNSFGMTTAYHQSSIFNNAFSSSYLGGDAKALCATDHPTNMNNSTSISNKGTTALSYDAVVATIAAGAALKTDRGLPMPSLYDVLYVPVGLQATAIEITNAIGKPGTANNDANFLQSRGLQVVVDPYLSDATNWFMIDSVQAKMHMLWFWRVMPELAVDPSSDFNLVAKYRGYMRYSFGWDDFRFIYGHEVAG